MGEGRERGARRWGGALVILLQVFRVERHIRFEFKGMATRILWHESTIHENFALCLSLVASASCFLVLFRVFRCLWPALAMEPALENLLRGTNVSVTWALRINDDRQVFVHFGDQSLKDSATDLCIDMAGGGLAHKREMAQLTRKVQTDAVARARAGPIPTLPCDLAGISDQFRAKYGSELLDDVLLAQPYFEGFEDRLSDGLMKAETRAHVVSLTEEKQQDHLKPDHSKQYGIHLDGKLIVFTKRRHVSTMPRDTEELSLASSAFKARPMYAGLTMSTTGGCLPLETSWTNCLTTKTSS